MRQLFFNSVNLRRFRDIKVKKLKVLIVKHSAKVHVYRYFSKKGFRNIYCFTENLNSELLCTIYKKTLLSSARNFFREDDNN